MLGQQCDSSPNALPSSQQGPGFSRVGIQSYGPYRQRKRVPTDRLELVVHD